MNLRIIMMLFVVIALTACSTTNDSEVGDISVDQREDITTGPFDGQGVDGSALGGPTPGTQQDLVVNVGDRVFFGYDRYDLDSEAQITLERQANWLKLYPNLTITVEGHADERGTREYNLALGDRRANSVKSYLIALGISPTRVTTISFGKERPAVLGSNPNSWAQNRRGVTVVE